MHKIIGVDLGATNVRAGILSGRVLNRVIKTSLGTAKKKYEVINLIYSLIDKIITSDVEAIGVGVPSVVDTKRGIVYNVVHIPSWNEVHVKELLGKKYKVPVKVNNDANCYALGEKYFGKGRNYDNMVGLTLGTGLGAGIILDNRLYEGHNCSAGEFGMIPYKDDVVETYCSGQFFKKFYHSSGKALIRRIKKPEIKKIFSEFGYHLGAAIKIVCFAHDPGLIVIGGSVSESYPYFKNAMWKEIKTFPYKPVLKNLKVEVSELKYAGLLGAAALFLD